MIQQLPALLNPLVGIIADKIRIRIFIAITPAVTCTTMSLLGVAPHYTVLAILLFVTGISASFFHVPGPVLTRQVAGNRVGKGMSYYMLGGEAARTLGPLIIVGAVSLWGLEGTFKLIPFGVAASLFVYIKLRDTRESPPIKTAKKQNGPGKTFLDLLPFFLILACLAFTRGFARTALTIFLPDYMKSEGASFAFSGVALSILQLAGAFGTAFAGSLSDKIGRKKTLVIIFLIIPVLMFIFLKVQGIFTILLLILMGFFLFAGSPILLALVNEIDSEHPSFVNGIYMSISFTTISVTSLLIGIFVDTFGYAFTYILSATLTFIAIPFVIMLPTKKKGNTDE
jgi:FSR family fosmidomycin resistance protein-like MFS transporter